MRMALLAQEGNRCHEQTVVIRAVWVVTIDAAVAHRRVLEQKWTALGCMTLIAGLIQGVGLEQWRSQRAMWIVAVGTGHLTFW